ncbi:MAG: excisionase family DNA-binding protein [Rhodobacteraceae bacterium]|nr:excisionase family DNA-binding protein [Paracoccaceae bacterium]
MDDYSLLTPRELAAETGWPEKRIRNLIATKSIRFLKNGANFLLPKNAVQDYIERNMFEPCQNNHKDQDSPNAKTAQIGSSGTLTRSQDNKKTSQQALKTAKMLRKSSKAS